MATLWYLILAFFLGGYAVLDGFDLGVGVLYLWAGRNEEERRSVLTAIGPVWDGNEVWLIAGGTVLFLAFPRVYAAGFSGFYLPLIIVLWLLMGRGLSIELRDRLTNPLWRTGLDTVFAVSSTLLAITFGVAIGNVINGVPLNPQGYYLGLFSWMLNPYALLMGLFSLALLALHGSTYLNWRTGGEVQARIRKAASRLWWLVAGLAVIATIATFVVRPAMADNFRSVPLYLTVPVLAVPTLVAVRMFLRGADDALSFLGSTGLIAALGLSTVIGLYPYLLPSRPHPERSFTVSNAAASNGSLFPATIWMSAGILLILVYTVIVYRTFTGKVALGHGEQH
jgi:cytochrome d ubiquinol oxidase subunit II